MVVVVEHELAYHPMVVEEEMVEDVLLLDLVREASRAPLVWEVAVGGLLLLDVGTCLHQRVAEVGVGAFLYEMILVQMTFYRCSCSVAYALAVYLGAEYCKISLKQAKPVKPILI